MPNKIAKAYAITDAKIAFVSLVDKAANKKGFLIAKSGNGVAQFESYGRIIKSDAASHYVTGIVYEPMVEDTQGNYMTEDEIAKAAHWFAKNGNGVDLQHSFEPMDGACVVESWIAKADFEINGETIKKGTWLMTMEITDQGIFDSIQKGEITGFSMGGRGVFSDQDVDISDPVHPLEKGAAESPEVVSFKQKIAKFLGFDTVEKGMVKDKYRENSIRDNFWTAFYALADYLFDSWNPATQRWEIQTDEAIVREALADFNGIVTELLAAEEPVTKCLNGGQVAKSGKAMSNANVTALKSIHESLGDFLGKFIENEEEEIDLTKADLEKTVAEAVAKAMQAVQTPAQNAQNASPVASGAEGTQITTSGVQKDAGGGSSATDGLTQADIDEMVAKAIRKATEPKAVTVEDVQSMIDSAVAKAMEPVMKSTGLPVGVNENVQKGETEQHYLAGIL